MGKHQPRSERWTRLGPNEYRSAQGRVWYRNGQWHAALTYRIWKPDEPQPEPVETWEAARFKRPRNAMIALEDKATELERRHGADVTFLDAEAL